ncbi:MAG: ABC transporter substrate-binding protein [Anaerotignum sp.]|nr:ABC transporter substrate-binding protein [Anaerotignum sp.]
MKTKKFMSMTMAAMMAAMAFTGCGGGETGESADGTATMVIGGTGPLTGDYATYGTSVKNGAQIAVDEINAAGGVNGVMLQLLFEDDQADPELAVNGYGKMMDDGMDVCLGGTTSGASIAISEESQQDGMLVLTPSGSQVECTEYDNSFRVCFNDPAQGTYSAKYIGENEMAKKVAIIYEKSTDYSVGITNAFEAEAANQPFEVVEKQAFTNQSNTDFSVQLQAVKASGAELLFLPIYAQEAAYILTQADKAGLDVVFFGVDGMDGVIEKIGADNVALTEGVMLLTPFAADSEAENVQAFVAEYKARHNMTPDQFAADAYDAVYAIKAAFEATGMASPDEEGFNEAMIEAMTKISVDGVTGSMTWTADGEPTKTAQAVVIQNGAYVMR